MASDIDLPRRKPPKQNLLSCFGCRSRRDSFKSKPRKEVEENKKMMRKKPRGLYWSIRKSATATVPVEDEAGAPTLDDVIKSGDVSRYSQRRLEPVVSAAGSHNYSNRQYTQQQDSDTIKRPRPSPSPPPFPPPLPIATSTLARMKLRRDADKHLDPTVGMSIVLVTLTVMVLWGHACAILCTAALFYIIPRLRQRPSDRDVSKEGLESAGGEIDLGSEENKKRVVLEGLLERNRRPDGLLPPLV